MPNGVANHSLGRGIAFDDAQHGHDAVKSEAEDRHHQRRKKSVDRAIVAHRRCLGECFGGVTITHDDNSLLGLAHSEGHPATSRGETRFGSNHAPKDAGVESRLTV